MMPELTAKASFSHEFGSQHPGLTSHLVLLWAKDSTASTAELHLI